MAFRTSFRFLRHRSCRVAEYLAIVSAAAIVSSDMCKTCSVDRGTSRDASTEEDGDIAIRIGRPKSSAARTIGSEFRLLKGSFGPWSRYLSNASGGPGCVHVRGWAPRRPVGSCGTSVSVMTSPSLTYTFSVHWNSRGGSPSIGCLATMPTQRASSSNGARILARLLLRSISSCGSSAAETFRRET